MVSTAAELDDDARTELAVAIELRLQVLHSLLDDLEHRATRNGVAARIKALRSAAATLGIELGIER